MAERQSVLTGRNGPAPVRAADAAPQDEGSPELNAALAAIEALNAQLARMGSDLSSANADLRAARADAHARIEALRQQLGEAADALSQAQADLARERAVSEGLAAQLASVETARASLQAPLEQAIAAAGAKQPINIPAYEHPAYELEVVGRDVNERAKRIVLKPIKAGA